MKYFERKAWISVIKAPRAVLFSASMVFMAFAPSLVLSGNVTYTLTKVSNPTVDQSDAYAKIKIAMDSAVLFYNTYTSITKQLSISYNTTIATADGNINGSIRFGPDRSYMVCGTDMHEIAHTVGVGTCSAWPGLIVNGRYTGFNANAMFRTIIGNQDTVLHGDSQHFWPYGINYESEVKSSADLIDHCKIVNAMQKDFYPSAVLAQSAGSASGAYFHAVCSGSDLKVFDLSGRLLSNIKFFRNGGVPSTSHTGSMRTGFYIKIRGNEQKAGVSLSLQK